jgi:hypothetical protein
VQLYRGGRTVCDDLVRRVRRELAPRQAARDVPLRCAGVPAQYRQVDWGEVRRVPFTQQAPATRYFLAGRLKDPDRRHGRHAPGDAVPGAGRRFPGPRLGALGAGVRQHADGHRRPRSRGTAGPVWTPALLHLTGEFGVHPQACDPGAGNQQGSVESLVRWVEGNFLLGRRCADAADLAAQAGAWCAQVNARPSAATGEPPPARRGAAAAKGGRRPLTAHDFGRRESGLVSREALVAVAGNRDSVPVAHAGAPVTVRLHRDRMRIWRDATCLADHPRAPDGARPRVIDPAHFAPRFPAKPRAQAMLYREVRLGLGGHAPAFGSALARRTRARLREEILAGYALDERNGAAALLAAMARADAAGTSSAAALARLLTGGPPPATPPPRARPGVPPPHESDRDLSGDEAWVEVAEALPEVAR